jgi:hypothetical protein
MLETTVESSSGMDDELGLNVKPQYTNKAIDINHI